MKTEKQYLIWKKTMTVFKKLFLCHQLPERSFHFKGFQFPLCARCTGILIGMVIIAPIISIFTIGNIFVSLAFILLMVFDGTLQLTTKYTSNNRRRLVTGICAGYGFISLIIQLLILIF